MILDHRSLLHRFYHFLQYILQHVLVQRQVYHPLFDFAIFILQLLEAVQFSYAHTREFVFPAVKRGLDNLHLTADINHGHAAFCMS